MQGAARLHEFIIKVAHPLEEHASKVYFHLHVVCVSFVFLYFCSAHLLHRFPKTYPTNTYATFTIQQPIKGLSHEQVSKLSNAIHAEAKVRKGSEAVHDVSFPLSFSSKSALGLAYANREGVATALHSPCRSVK